MGRFFELYLGFMKVFIIEIRWNILCGHILHEKETANANNRKKKEKKGRSFEIR